jgi:hypothetical protein
MRPSTAFFLHPRQGHSRPDLTSRRLRFHPVRDFLIAYAPFEQQLVVFAILHVAAAPALSRPYCVDEVESQLYQRSTLALLLDSSSSWVTGAITRSVPPPPPP